MNLARPISAGIVTALVGFTSSFMIVLAGLTAVGATPGQAASGLMSVTILMGVATIVLATRYRMPITIAWSTPGAALLAASATHAEFSEAVGAFLIVAALILLTALVPQLGALIARIPTAIAQAMLAGVLLPLCLAPVTGIVTNPWGVVPVVLTWLVLLRFAPRWAVPGAFVAATVVVIVGLVQRGEQVEPAALLPHLELTSPTFTVTAIVGVAVPLFLVTMASQNVPGVAVMRSYGYEVPWRPSMLVTGLGTAAGAPFGGHAINLAAISAALAAAPEADPDPKRRWIASLTSGIGVIILGLCSSVFVVLVVLAPDAVIPAVAGLALLATLGSALEAAVKHPGERIPAVVTVLVAASGLSIWGIGPAFWSLVAGLLVRGALWRPARAS